MKKLTIQFLAGLAMVAFASVSFAATISDTTSIGGSPLKPSTKVTIEAAATITTYTATSCHLSGTKEYATAGGAVAAGVDGSTIKDQAIPAQGTNTACNPTDPGTAGSLPF